MGLIELVLGENGRQTLRVPKELLAAGEKVVALEAALATVTAQVAALQAAASQPDRLSRTGAAFEEWMRGQAEAIEDGGALIAAAMAKAKEVSTPEHPVTWEQVLGLATPAGVTTTQTKADPKQLEAQKDAAEQKKRADTAEAALVVAAVPVAPASFHLEVY